MPILLRDCDMSDAGFQVERMGSLHRGGDALAHFDPDDPYYLGTSLCMPEWSADPAHTMYRRRGDDIVCSTLGVTVLLDIRSGDWYTVAPLAQATLLAVGEHWTAVDAVRRALQEGVLTGMNGTDQTAVFACLNRMADEGLIERTRKV